MAEPEPVQSRGIGELTLGLILELALCLCFLSCLLLPFYIPVSALLEPAGTNTSNESIKLSAALPVLLWCLGCGVAFARRSDSPMHRVCWALGSVLLLFHVAVAFHLGHGWSHHAAWEHTRQSGGYGDGIFVNYAFALVWLVDAIWVCVSFRSYLARPRWLNWTIHGFLAFVVFNAAVVFGGTLARIAFTLGFLFPVGTVATLMYERCNAPRTDNAPENPDSGGTTPLDQK